VKSDTKAQQKHLELTGRKSYACDPGRKNRPSSSHHFGFFSRPCTPKIRCDAIPSTPRHAEQCRRSREGASRSARMKMQPTLHKSTTQLEPAAGGETRPYCTSEPRHGQQACNSMSLEEGGLETSNHAWTILTQGCDLLSVVCTTTIYCNRQSADQSPRGGCRAGSLISGAGGEARYRR
jgi:hypothetical protein